MVTISAKFKKLFLGFSTLRGTLLITYICIGFIPLLFFTTTVFNTVDNYFVNERQKELLNQANMISVHISSSGYLFDESKKVFFDNSIERSAKNGNFRVIVTDSTGTVINDSNKSYIGKTYLIPEVIEALNNKDVANLQDNGIIYAAVSIVDDSSNKVGTVLLAAQVKDISTTMNGIKKQVYLLLLGIVVIVGILMFLLSQAFSEPLKNMLMVIRKMSDGHLEQRVSVSDYYPLEIKELALACNVMADKLEHVEISRQQFVSNVSHELKTPLSSIKVLSESMLLENEIPKEMYAEFLQDINSEIDRMADIINDLLTLVKLDQKEVPLKIQETNLNKLLESIIKRLLPLAKIKNINVTFEGNKEIFADVDSMKLSLALSNLIENAIKYTPDCGNVKVILDGDHQNVFFTVSDTGIGIAENEIGKIFDRFYRVDKTRDRKTGGTGLGLAITHSTVLIHNGSIKVTSKENTGTTFVVRIPLRQNS